MTSISLNMHNCIIKKSISKLITVFYKLFMHTLGIMTIHKKVIIIFQFKPLTFFFLKPNQVLR